MLGYPIKRCYVFKDIFQVLIDAEVLKLRPEQKKVTTNMTSFFQFGVQPPTPAGVVPIPKGETRVLNTDPHHQRKKGLESVLTPQEEIMWVYPDLSSGLLLQIGSPEAKQKLRLTMWYVLTLIKQKMMSPR